MKKRKTGENRIMKFLGALFSYLLAVASVIIFALFCSGRVGWFLLLIVIGAPLISFIWTFISYWFVSINMSTTNFLVEKGEYKNFQVKIINKGILPVPAISIYLKNDNRVNIRNSMISRNTVIYGENTVDVEMFTVFAGLSEVLIEKVVVSDFFGVFKFRLKKAKSMPDTRLEIGILPNIPSLEQEDDWLLTARSAAFDGEEPEETVSDRSATFGGFPGFEHRDYVEGDPIKRINYKLSARVGRLQVRLDEEQAVAGISMYLSTVLPDDMKPEEPYIKNSSLCLEEFIGVARHLYLMDFSVKIILPESDPFELTDERSIEVLREKLAYQRFEVNRLPDSSILNTTKGSLIVCMTYNVHNVIELLKRYSSLEGNTVSIYVSSIEKGRRL